MKIIAHVKIRSTVAVQIAEHSRKTPVMRWSGKGIAIFVKKRSFGPGQLGEFAATQISIEPMRLAVFQHTAVGHEFQVLAVLGPDHPPPADVQQSHARRANRCRPVVCDIQIQVSVAIDVGQRAGGRPVAATQAAVHHLAENTVAIIQKEASANTNSVDQQIQITVAIDIRESCTGRKLSCTSDAGAGGNVGEPPPAQISV